MNKAYSIVISTLVVAIFFGLAYLVFHYFTSTSNSQLRFENSIVATFPIFAIMAAGVAFLIWIAALIFMLIDPKLSSTDKLIWTLVIIFLNFLGALIYFFVRPYYIGKPTTKSL